MIPARSSPGKAIGGQKMAYGCLSGVVGHLGHLGTRRLRGGVAVFFSFDTVVNLFTVDGHVLGRVDADPDLVPLDAQNRHGDLVSDHHRFTHSSRQYQHVAAPSSCGLYRGKLDWVRNLIAVLVRSWTNRDSTRHGVIHQTVRIQETADRILLLLSSRIVKLINSPSACAPSFPRPPMRRPGFPAGYPPLARSRLARRPCRPLAPPQRRRCRRP